MKTLSDFIGTNEEEQLNAADLIVPEETTEIKAEEKSPEVPEEKGAEDKPENKEEEKQEGESKDDKTSELEELEREFGGIEELRDATSLHQAFIQEDTESLGTFVTNLHALSPERFEQLAELMVSKYAPAYGFVAPEADETQESEDFDDDDLTDREKTLAEENAQLKARLRDEEDRDQQSTVKARQESFFEDVGGVLEELVGSLGLHPKQTEAAVKDISIEITKTKEFQSALKAAEADDGKRKNSLFTALRNVAQNIVKEKSPDYALFSNALKTHEANLKPREKAADEAKIDAPPPAQIQPEINANKPLPKRGSPLGAYI